MSDKTLNWNNLPGELQERPQWAVSGASKAPMGIGPQGGLRLVSVREPSTWMSFADACLLAWANRSTVTTHVTNEGVTVRQQGLDVGYMLNAGDPFACVDLDVKDAATHPNNPEKWTTPDDFQRYLSIVEHLDSYTEKSKSGKGAHIWVKGNIGKGFHGREGVEIYSQERYIISTGDVWIPKPIANREFLLQNMLQQMRPLKEAIELEELPEEADDWYILQVAINAANSEKFTDLWKGKWREYSFPSQSEADLALLSMFTFYSDSNAQCRRLFRESGLGKREKATKNDQYLNNTLKKIRDRQARERNVELSGILKAAEQVQLAQQEIQQLQGGVPPVQQVQGAFGAVAPRTVTPLQVPGTGEPVLTSPPPESQLAQMAPVTESAVAAGAEGIAWPPGFVGALAQFIYNSSYLPIKEVSLAAALGLMAGICGKAWHIPKSGLNLYIVLVARSAIGKEALHTGISTVVSAAIREFPQFGNFVDFTEYASGPALIKACAQNTSFVNVSGEWGRRMKRIAMEDEREGPMTTLRTQMTNLYQKSAPMSIVGGIGYSSQENNVEALQAVAYSMVGESTPQTFYDSLTESMMEDGFLSRFLIIAYDGERPETNINMIDAPDTALTKYLTNMAFQADTNIGNAQSQPVGRTEEAARILAAFGHKADNKIRSYTDEARRQMWNRATLKVLRVAALLAVGDNYIHPVIEAHHANWAIDLIMSDIAIMQKRISSGDVGLGDTSRERKAVNIISEFLSKPIPQSYKVPEEMRTAGIIPRPYLQVRTARASAFYKHRFGPNKALDETLGHLVNSGYLMEVKGDKLVDMFNYHGKAYRILKIPNYEEMASDKD